MTNDEISALVSKPRESGVSFVARFDGTGHKHGGGATRGKSGANVYLVATKGASQSTLGFSASTMRGHEQGIAEFLEVHMRDTEALLA